MGRLLQGERMYQEYYLKDYFTCHDGFYSRVNTVSLGMNNYEAYILKRVCVCVENKQQTLGPRNEAHASVKTCSSSHSLWRPKASRTVC